MSKSTDRSRPARRRDSGETSLPERGRLLVGLSRDVRHTQGAMSPDGPGNQADARVELGVYIGRELGRGRNLFDVLGDAVVWAQVQDDPFLLSKVANDERVLAALARHEAGQEAALSPPPSPSRFLPQNGGGVTR